MPLIKDRQKTTGFEILGVCLGLLLILSSLGGLVTAYRAHQNLEQSTLKWRERHSIAETQGASLAGVLRHFGYGGFIHNFKDYLLRQDPNVRMALDGDLAELHQDIERLEPLLGAPKDIEALKAIKEIISEYETKIPLADEAVKASWPAEKVDHLVAIDDRPALEALRTLQESWLSRMNDDKAWFSKVAVEGAQGLNLLFIFLPFLAIAGLGIIIYLRRLRSETAVRLKAEAEVARGRLIVESLAHLGIGVSIADRNLDIIATNKEFVRLYGLPPELGSAGSNLAEIFRFNARRGEYGPGDVEDLVRERTEATLKFEAGKLERTRPDGTIIEVERFPLPQGGMVSIYTDVTARRFAERELARKDTQLVTALDSMSAGIIFFDDNLKVRLANDSARTLLGFPPEFIKEGMPMQALWRIRAERGEYGDGDPETLVQDLTQRYKTGNFDAQEERVSTDGRHINTYRASTPDGGTVIVYNDITERVRAEERLKRNEAELTRYIEDLELSQQRLEDRTQEIIELAEKYAVEKDRAEASERSKSEFLASMSHEIRTPMTGVLGMADILLETELRPYQRDTVYKIKSAGQSLLTIINDILDLSKLEAGKLEIEQIDFNLPSVINDAVDLIRPKADDKGLFVAIDMTTSLPKSVAGDPTRIRQILINLIGNAVKFTQDGGVTVEVRHETADDGGYELRFAVTDTGIGIPADVRDNLFQDFTQADASTSRKYEGTGLGLAISKRLTELMGGEIGVDSIAGEGSTFWFTVTARRATTEVAEVSSKVAVQNFHAARSIRILIAEDNQLNQMILNSILEPLGHTLTFVGTGAAAVEAVRNEEFDLILMDVRMPEMSGPDATRAIRQLPGPEADIPVVAVTADVLQDHVAGYLEAGMNAAVNKPIDRSELMARMNEVLGEEIHVPAEAMPVEGRDLEVRQDTGGHPQDIADGEQPELEEDVGDFLKQLNSMTG